MDRVIGSAIGLAIEIYLVWKIWTALRRAVVTIEIGQSSIDGFHLKITAERATLPGLYWSMLAILALAALAVGSIVVLIVSGGIH
jgi:hypothetical protein